MGFQPQICGRMKRERKLTSVAILCQVLEDAGNISSCWTRKSMVRTRNKPFVRRMYSDLHLRCPYCVHICVHPHVQVSLTILAMDLQQKSSQHLAGGKQNFIWCLNLPVWMNDHQLNKVAHLKPAVLHQQCNFARCGYHLLIGNGRWSLTNDLRVNHLRSNESLKSAPTLSRWWLINGWLMVN